MSSWVMVLCLSLLSLRRLPVLYLLPSARRISSTTNPMIPLIINMPFLSLNPKKLCLDLRLGRPPAIPAGQLLDKVTARRSPERTTSHRAAPIAIAVAQARNLPKDEWTWRGVQKLADDARAMPEIPVIVELEELNDLYRITKKKKKKMTET